MTTNAWEGYKIGDHWVESKPVSETTFKSVTERCNFISLNQKRIKTRKNKRLGLTKTEKTIKCTCKNNRLNPISYVLANYLSMDNYLKTVSYWWPGACSIALLNSRELSFPPLSLPRNLQTAFCNWNVLCGHFISLARVSGVESRAGRGARGGGSSPHRGNALPLTCRTCSRRYHNRRETERDGERDLKTQDKDARRKEKMIRQ